MLNGLYDYRDYGKLKLICPGFYANGQYALQLVRNGELYTTITVCLETDIADDEIIIKDYSENEGMLEWCFKNKIVDKVVRKERAGYVECPVCKLNKDLYEEILILKDGGNI